MTINEQLLDSIKEDLWKYDLDEYRLISFLKCNDSKRPDHAVNLISRIMVRNGKEDLYRNISELSRIERGTKGLRETGRDHVSHAVLSFILGIYINKNFIEKYTEQVDPFEWKLAGLFHDFGYPLEIAGRISDSFKKNVHHVASKYSLNGFSFSSRLEIEAPILSNGRSSLDVIQDKINEWGIDLNTNEEFNQKKLKGEVCHGIVSSLVLIKLLDSIYAKYNPKRLYEYIEGPFNTNVNQKNFDIDIVSACSAIFLHNFKTLRTRIHIKSSPVAFLLKISDCLQDWERPKAEDSGNPSSQYRIGMDQKTLLLSINNHKREEIIKELESCLDIKCEVKGDELRITANT
jgi:hypothetical protein